MAFGKKKKEAAPATAPEPAPGVTVSRIPGGTVWCQMHGPKGDPYDPYAWKCEFSSNNAEVVGKIDQYGYYIAPPSFTIANEKDARLLAQFYSRIADIFAERGPTPGSVVYYCDKCGRTDKFS